MPSERSKPSEITGEKAARSKVRSISLATCCKPFCTTTRVTGSIASIALRARAELGAQVLQHALPRAGLPAHPLVDREVLDLRHHLEGHEHRARLGQDGRDAGLEVGELVEGERAGIAGAPGDDVV